MSFKLQHCLQYNTMRYFRDTATPLPFPYPSFYELMAGAYDVTREAVHCATPGIVSCPATLHGDSEKAWEVMAGAPHRQLL
jgi:hypothetical protein